MTIAHEFSAPLWVITPLGEGLAILMIDYGLEHNPVFLVRLGDGRLRCVDMLDCIACENPMLKFEGLK